MEQSCDFLGTKVPQRRGVARDALANAVIALAGRALWTKAFAPLTNAQRQAVAGAKINAVAGSAGDIAVA